MQLIDDLRAEHGLIERMVGSLRSYVAARTTGRGEPQDAIKFMDFFHHFAGTFHHAKEEEVLFRSLIEKAELPADRGPILAMTAEHRHMEGLLQLIDPLVRSDLSNDADQKRLQELVKDYSHSLLRHIDAENSVLFPEGEERLRRFHVRELPSRPMAEAEQAAWAHSQQLPLAYPPRYDPEVHRGEGCVACPSFGSTCDGLEREWWTDLEWEEARARTDSD